MKKVFLVLLVVLCMASVLSLGVGAAVPDEFATWEVNGEAYGLPPFITSMLDSFLSIIPGLHQLIVTYVGQFAFAVYGGVAIVLLVIAAFGYRFLNAMRGTLGLVAGLLVGYIGWCILMSTVTLPAAVYEFIAMYEVIVKWSVIGVCALIGAVLTIILRRIGTAISFALVATVCLLPCIRHIYVLLGVLAFMLVFSLFKSRVSVIMLTSFGIPTFLIYFLVGPNGFYPVDLSMFVSPVVNPYLLLGLIIGTIFAMVHFRVSRKVRA